MLTKLLTNYLLSVCIVLAAILLLSANVHANFGYLYPDSLVNLPDTLALDTLDRSDTIIIKSTSNAIDAKVKYNCRDSTYMDFQTQKVYLYGDAEIYYKNISLKAAFIEIDFEKNLVYATGLPDSTGEIIGDPVFSEGNQSFKSETMKYNYKSEKGLISGVFTEDGYGYLHGKTVKKMENDEFNIAGGSYTTCELEDHPHFEFRYNKSRVIPGKRIVTGPAYLVIEEAPTPLAIPFGWFPAEQGRRNGILIPTWGESANRGFYFEGAGYYLSLGQHFDLKVTGDIYTKGSWAIKPSMRYRKRYKYSGNFNFSIAKNILGTKHTPDYSSSNDFSITWNHKQDKAARPNSTFSANVNIRSTAYNKFNPTSTQDYLSNTFRSSIAYQTNFGGKYFLSMSAGHEQSTRTKNVSVTLPEISFNVNQFYPLRRKNQVGKPRWYENISVVYNVRAVNKLSNPDSLFFSVNTLETAQNGIDHSVPVSSSIPLLKYITWTNSLNLRDRMYFQKYDKYWVDDTLFINNDTIVGYENTDTIRGFNNLFDFNFSTSLSTRIYGMFQFGNKMPVSAIRHVLTPSVSFSYTPDFGTEGWGYWDSYIGEDGEEVRYSKYDGAIYGYPPPSKSGRIGFSLSNNLEMKVRSRKDTVTGMKKIVLIENFSISGSYDLARDSLNLSKIVMSGRTTLFKNLKLLYRSTWDPYVLDSTGNRNLNQFEWDKNRRLLRLDNTNWNISLSWRVSSSDFKKDKERESETGTEAELEEINMAPDQYIDWDIPWDLNIAYTFNYTVNHLYPNYEHQRNDNIVQSLRLTGNVSLTPKWKVGFVTGWDFDANDLSYTSVSIYRDLHCWEMRLNWVPVGFHKSWNFSINAKASILQDLKLTKKKDWRDF